MNRLNPIVHASAAATTATYYLLPTDVLSSTRIHCPAALFLLSLPLFFSSTFLFLPPTIIYPFFQFFHLYWNQTLGKDLSRLIAFLPRS